MFALTCLLLLQAPPTLKDVYALVRKMPGVEIHAEMASPTVQQVLFKISTTGLMWVRYSTSEEFVGLDKTTTWMPGAMQYSVRKNEGPNPVPAGFDCLWPGAAILTQTGDATPEAFYGKDCFRLPCKGDAAYTINLFVEKGTLMPFGTRVELNGTTYEMVYRSVKVAPQDPKLLTFRPVKGAKPYKPGPIPQLVKPGTKLRTFEAKDFGGKKHTLASLLKDGRGLVLNFWFAGCTGCWAEMPYLVKLYPRLREHGIQFVGVNGVDNAKYAGLSSKKNSLPFPTLIGKGALDLVGQIKVKGYPVTVVIDAKGVIVDAIQSFDEARLQMALKKVSPNWQ